MHVLILDDEISILDGISAIIRSIDTIECEITAVTRAVDALTAMRRRQFDLIITDIEMPGMDGLSFIRNVKDANSNCKIIVLSGHGEFDYVREAFKHNVIDYLLKPVDIGELKALITAAARNLQMNAGGEGNLDAVLGSFFPQGKMQGLSRRLQNIVEFIQNNIGEDISLGRLSRFSGLSESYICKLFKKETGITYLEFVNQLKVRKAFYLLIYDHRRSIREISVELGYSDERQFFRVFKSIVGMTPNEFRENTALDISRLTEQGVSGFFEESG